MICELDKMQRGDTMRAAEQEKVEERMQFHVIEGK